MYLIVVIFRFTIHSVHSVNLFISYNEIHFKCILGRNVPLILNVN